MKRKDNDAGPTPIEWLLSEVEALPISDRDRDQVKGLLRRMSGRVLHISKRELVGPERLRLAISMLRAGSTTTEVRKEVAARLGCSRWTAQRIVTEALNVRAIETKGSE